MSARQETEEARALMRASLTFAVLECVICVFQAICAQHEEEGISRLLEQWEELS